jgi:hypothetical protein
VLLTESNFPDLDRLLFAHELLNNSAIVDEIGPLDDLLSEPGLVAIPVHQVLQRQWFWRALDEVLSVEDVGACRQITTSDCIYVHPHRRRPLAHILFMPCSVSGASPQ